MRMLNHYNFFNYSSKITSYGKFLFITLSSIPIKPPVDPETKFVNKVNFISIDKNFGIRISAIVVLKKTGVDSETLGFYVRSFEL